MRPSKKFVAWGAVVASCLLVVVLAFTGRMPLLAMESEILASTEPIVAVPSLRNESHLFGGPVTAEVILFVNRDLVDAESVRIAPDFAPYTAVGPSREFRWDAGRITLVSFSATLQCIDDVRCLHADEPVVLRPTIVSFAFLKEPSRRQTREVFWQPFTPSTQVAPGDLEHPMFRQGKPLLSRPSLSFGADPFLVAWLFLSIGIAGCVAGGVAFVRTFRAPQAPAAFREDGAGDSTPTALEAAILRVRAASASPQVRERRLALEELARALGHSADAPLADEIQGLAWHASPAPDGAAMRAIAAKARRVSVEEGG